MPQSKRVTTPETEDTKITRHTGRASAAGEQKLPSEPVVPPTVTVGRTPILADERLKSVQKQHLARQVSRLQGNRRLEKLIEAQSPATLGSAINRQGYGVPAAGSDWCFTSTPSRYLDSFRPPATGRMAPTPSSPPHHRLQTQTALHSIMRKDEEPAEAAPEAAVPPAAEMEAKGEPYMLGLYDYNETHMKAWPDAQARLLEQWKSYLGGKTSSQDFYKKLKAGGYLDQKYAEKVADQEEYMRYLAQKSRLEDRLKSAKGKTKEKFEKELADLEEVSPIADVESLVVDTAKNLQKESIKGWAIQWGKATGGEVYPVTDEKEAQAKMEDVVEAHSPAQLQVLALFGHGSWSSGWIKMGDVGKMLLKDKVKANLSPNLQVILYMCSAGQTREESFAAKLAGKLKKIGLTGPEVWAHTSRGSAVYNPNWLVFKDIEAGGEFYRTVFNEDFVTKESERLETAWGGKDELSTLTGGILRIKQPRSVEELMEKWYSQTGSRDETRGHIEYAPLKQKESVKALQQAWKDFIDAELQRSKEKLEKKQKKAS